MMDAEKNTITAAALGAVLLIGLLFSLYGKPEVLVLAADPGAGQQILDTIRKEKPELRGPAVIKVITTTQSPSETLLRLKWAQCRGVKAVGLGARVPSDSSVEEQMDKLTKTIFTYKEEA